MGIYTKTGDQGTTTLVNANHISKSDDRIELLGTIDELTSHLGIVKAASDDAGLKEFLERIQQNLMTVMAREADFSNRSYRLGPDEVKVLEEEIDRLENSFLREHQFILPGGCPRSAQIDVARTVARRAERRLAPVDRKYGSDPVIRQYMNRLSDYLYVLARYTDALAKEAPAAKNAAVLSSKGAPLTMNLDVAKRLIEAVEKHALEKGMRAVVAVCNDQGNPVAVHVMDDAFLVSYDVAVKKAYTAVAVKMPTIELKELVMPGQTFYGLENLDNGKLSVLGGGVPLYSNGHIIGGLGVSGGTGEEDNELAVYGQGCL